MNKLAVNLGIIATILLITGCASNNISDSSAIDAKSSYIIDDTQSQPLEAAGEVNGITKDSGKANKFVNTTKIPISMLSKDVKDIRFVEVEENSSLEEKVETIINFISHEAFNDLPIKVTVYGEETARVELVEPTDIENSRVSWKDDYLNEYTKEYTVNAIIKNIIQEGYKGTWIKNVQLYYEDELISLD
ncbi:hypothetical protein [Faecalimicrobium dakarense]|uniref:hypothetical protein n=1 Tax=Faecalimicrobium dakarense TaxID=1301100 RepID=UPI0004BC16DA|nr:hypothetical protein [[Clostridium] dakarense]